MDSPEVPTQVTRPCVGINIALFGRSQVDLSNFTSTMHYIFVAVHTYINVAVDELQHPRYLDVHVYSRYVGIYSIWVSIVSSGVVDVLAFPPNSRS